ncbi:MAG: LacI family DNA-binding transcriptional regulator [Micromonosporaceae bacterium]|jgi:DNA-binding LacI/PurR family transcriptional regulator|nr:LacI family DNA-binding transcriptional regulator [Micromonosporaceae bacterium]
MARIDDVARLAGVSTATVSRALRGLPVVSELTRMRVLEAAKQLGYVASPNASRLAGGKTRSVAVVVARITRWFFATVVEAAEETLHQAGYDMVLYNLGGRPESRRKLFSGPTLTHRADALMLVCTPLDAPDIATVERLAIPVVAVSECVRQWPTVCIDDVAAARTAMEHLLTLGHRRIAHIGGEGADQLAGNVHLNRRRGYLEALRAAGIEPDPALDIKAEFSLGGAIRATTELLRRGEPPTAIFAACDEMAMGAMAVLREAGLRVPEDVSVIGIDDHDMAAAVGLSTVAQPAAEQGQLAATMLLERLYGVTEAPAAPTVLPTRLVVRGSTGPPRR